MRNGNFDLAGFKRAVARALELARGHFTMAPVISRAVAGCPGFAAYSANAARAWLLSVTTSNLQQASQECAHLTPIHPTATADLMVARQFITTQLEAIRTQHLQPLSNPISELVRRYAVAHARWLSTRDVKGAEDAAQQARNSLDAALTNARQARQAVTDALIALRSQPITNAITRAEQSAWMHALSNAVPRSLGVGRCP
ncbi:MAG: hypothetical protein RBG13Loki_0850 [Promethearchaeota archaeon CR_4]|nr:MAG: hypothetical protein RBG13Loki_0850 [Candidatus Lokiarchaeota archaeon CR_4]